MNPPDEATTQELNEFFRECRESDKPLDDLVDRLLAVVPGPRLVEGVAAAIATGPAEDWPAALQLVGLLGGEHLKLWNSLIDAIEHRDDLSWSDLVQGIALAKLQNRLPASGRAAEIADEWAEETADSDADLDILLRLLEDDPDDAPAWLGGIAHWPATERAQFRESLENRPPGRGRDTLITWLDSIESEVSESRSHILKSEDGTEFTQPEIGHPAREPLRQSVASLWATDLVLDGTFGVGLETQGTYPRRFVVAGTLADGVRFAESFEPTDDDSFVPRLPDGRRISFHPVFVREALRRMIASGNSPGGFTDPFSGSLVSLGQELASHSSRDASAWENWTRILVETNPLDRKPSSLAFDAESVLNEADHWLIVDQEAYELASEFRIEIDQVPIDRLRSAMRVWFERSLGPRMGWIIDNLRLMSYFWLSLADLAPPDSEHRWYAAARASARIVEDLSDPSRVVASHPFVELWMKRVLEKAAHPR